MTVQVIRGNMFNSKMQTLTCTINVVGVMGAGIAKEFRSRYPELFDYYRSRYPFHRNPRTTDLDNVLIHQLLTYPINQHQQCLLFPTKKHWINPSQIEWIDENLELLSRYYVELGITSLALPALGCSNGKLNFEDVLPLIKKHLDPLPFPIEVYYGHFR